MPDFTGAGVAILVVNYGSSALLEHNLAPLSRALPNAVTVVVDNLTTADERARLTALGERENWRLVKPDSNLGFGSGVNAAAAAAPDARALLILNPDATIEPAALATLVERAEREPLALLCPRIIRPDASTWFAGADLHLVDGRLRSPRSRPVDDTLWEPWVTGACLVLTIDLWRTVGGFDDRYFLYWEDVDLSHRVLAAGGSVVVCDEVTAVHAEGGTQGDGHDTAGLPKSDTYYYFTIRNRLLFAALHLDDAAFARWTSNAPTVAREVLLQGGRRQFLRSLRPLVVAWRALRDGRRLAREVRAAAHPSA